MDALERFLGDVLVRETSLPEICRAFVRGGKRLRARLLFACVGEADNIDEMSARHAAAAIEVFHAASLVHDDVVDRSLMRRGRPALHHTLGVRDASLSGWHLGQLALTLMAEVPHTVRVRFAEAGQAMSRGQLEEIARTWDVAVLPEDRLAVMEQKTAAIFGLACEVGGVCGAEDRPTCARLRRLGEAFGMLFQIADDVDDLYATAEELGREPGADLGAGVISLLGAFALQSPSRADAVVLLGGGSGLSSADAVTRCRDLMRSCGALDATHAEARRYAQSARGHLRVLPANEGTTWMAALLEGTLARIARHVDAAH